MLRDWKLQGALLMLLGAGRASAHHSFAAEFDGSRTVTLRGTVVAMEWVNPHSSLTLDVAAGGRVERWMLEMGPPNALVKRGLRKTMLLSGTAATVTGYPAKDGRRTASADTIK